jgi:MFS transporter, OFA family, oxalate/formate antiporter
MKQSPSFRKRACILLLLGVAMMYFYSGFQSDHLNVLTPYYLKLGWTTTAVTNPVTWAGFAIIPATFLVGTLLLMFGVPKVLVPSAVIEGLSVILLAFAGQNKVVYNISLFCVRLFVLPLQMGGFMLCTNWFVKMRGRALGIVTLGSPLCTATFIPILSKVTTLFGFRTAYTIAGTGVLILAVLIAVFIRSTPEETGLHPDGANYAYAGDEETIKMSVKDVFCRKESWLLIVSYGLLQFCIVAVMSFYVVRLTMTGTQPALYFSCLSAAAVLGIPISCLFGIIDDKFGTVKASFVLCATFLLSLAGLLLMKKNDTPMLILTAVGLAGVTGGTPTLHPSITSYVFGRARYQAANRWLMTVQAVIMAFAVYFMSVVLDKTGSLAAAYKIMMVLVLVSVLCLVVLGRTSDYDRS